MCCFECFNLNLNMIKKLNLPEPSKPCLPLYLLNPILPHLQTPKFLAPSKELIFSVPLQLFLLPYTPPPPLTLKPSTPSTPCLSPQCLQLFLYVCILSHSTPHFNPPLYTPKPWICSIEQGSQSINGLNTILHNALQT